jgi:dipeptidyl aminopeptidase/acylaminoacyl peptidase
MAESVQMFSALKKFGVETKFVLFHGESHDLSRSSEPTHRIRRPEESTGWMDKYLK